jgi:hypothetical protein
MAIRAVLPPDYLSQARERAIRASSLAGGDAGRTAIHRAPGLGDVLTLIPPPVVGGTRTDQALDILDEGIGGIETADPA